MNDKIATPHGFLAVEMRVYPTRKPEEAKVIEVPEQTVKMQAIRLGMLKRAENGRTR